MSGLSPVDTANSVDISGLQSTVKALVASLTQRYPACPDDMAEAQVSSGCVGLEFLPVETGGSGS